MIGKYGRFQEEDKWFKRIFTIMLVLISTMFLAILGFWIAIGYGAFTLLGKIS